MLEQKLKQNWITSRKIHKWRVGASCQTCQRTDSRQYCQQRTPRKTQRLRRIPVNLGHRKGQTVEELPKQTPTMNNDKYTRKSLKVFLSLCFALCALRRPTGWLLRPWATLKAWTPNLVTFPRIDLVKALWFHHCLLHLLGLSGLGVKTNTKINFNIIKH